jgi:hypothetical protein
MAEESNGVKIAVISTVGVVLAAGIAVLPTLLDRWDGDAGANASASNAQVPSAQPSGSAGSTYVANPALRKGWRYVDIYDMGTHPFDYDALIDGGGDQSTDLAVKPKSPEGTADFTIPSGTSAYIFAKGKQLLSTSESEQASRKGSAKSSGKLAELQYVYLKTSSDRILLIQYMGDKTFPTRVDIFLDPATAAGH